MPAAPNFFANGNINPSRFVAIDPTAGKSFFVVQSGNNGIVVGVSQDGVRRAPGTPYDDGFAAIQNEPIQVFGPGDECLVKAGGTIVQGDFLQSDASGQAIKLDVTTAAATHYSGGRALEDAANGELFRILVLPQVFKVA